MSSQTFLDKCKAVFQQANGGQPLTVGALAAVIRKACPSYQGSDQDIAQMFLELDTNEDRLISWEEFENALIAKDPKEVTRAELEELFKSIDKDRSGKLNRNEVKRLCQESGLKLSDQRLDQMIDDADHDKDGQISYDEFLKAWFNEN